MEKQLWMYFQVTPESLCLLVWHHHCPDIRNRTRTFSSLVFPWVQRVEGSKCICSKSYIQVWTSWRWPAMKETGSVPVGSCEDAAEGSRQVFQIHNVPQQSSRLDTKWLKDNKVLWKDSHGIKGNLTKYRGNSGKIWNYCVFQQTEL